MTISPAAPPPTTAADFTPEQLELRERARRFVDEVLIPNEELAERAGGDIPRRADAAHQARGDRRAALGRAPRRRARRPGLGEDRVVPRRGAARPLDERALLAHARRLQRAGQRHARADRPLAAAGAARRAARRLRGHRGRRRLGPVAASRRPRGRTDGGWVIDGEKWFVTYGDVAAVYIVMANALVDGQEQPTLFLVDRRLGRHRDRRRPAVHAHLPARPPDDPLHRRRGARRRRDRRRGRRRRPPARVVHRGAARHRGARRGLDVAADRGDHRLGDRAASRAATRLIDYQGVSFPLADSAADAAAGRLLALEVARLADAGADPKVVHAKASMAKLFVSEAACRCADRAVQIFGGRGYMRTNVAERFYRELRVDRIWEGTSEIQRLIVARALERRGVERTLH